MQKWFKNQIVPGAPPANISAFATSPTTIKVSWKPPPQDRSNGRIVYYKLFFVEEGRIDSEADAVKLNTTEFVLDELKRWTEYKIWVLAGTSVGDGPKSYPITVQTHEDGMYFLDSSVNSNFNINHLTNETVSKTNFSTLTLPSFLYNHSTGFLSLIKHDHFEIFNIFGIFLTNFKSSSFCEWLEDIGFFMSVLTFLFFGFYLPVFCRIDDIEDFCKYFSFLHFAV